MRDEHIAASRATWVDSMRVVILRVGPGVKRQLCWQLNCVKDGDSAVLSSNTVDIAELRF